MGHAFHRTLARLLFVLALLFFLAIPAAAQTGEVSGRVWEDQNGNGLQDGQEPGIVVDLELYDSQGTLLISQTTEPTGSFYFGSLPADDYSVLVAVASLPFAYTQTFDTDGLTTPHQVFFPLPAGSSANGIDFGYIGPGEVSGRVWEDQNGNGLQDGQEPGIVVDLELYDSQGTLLISQTTELTGSFYFGSLPPDDYSVLVDVTSLPFAYTQTFDTDGLTTPHQVFFPLPAGSSANGIDFGYIGPAEVYGEVWEDQNGNGIRDNQEPGIPIEVQLRDDQGNLISSMNTEPTGFYGFTGLPPGDYSVLIDPALLPDAYTQTFDFDGLATPHQVFFPVPAGSSVGNINFGYIGPAEVYGEVWEDQNGNGIRDNQEPGIPIEVQLRDDQGNLISSKDTEITGFYDFTGLPPGDYSVLIDPALLPDAYTQTFDFDGLESPNQIFFPVPAGGSVGGLNFGYIGPAEVYGEVWEDQNGNGIRDNQEPGIPIEVQLRDDQGNLISSKDTEITGFYDFTGLPPGDYSVLIDPAQLPAGATPTYDFDDIDTPHQAFFSVPAGGSIGDVGFGYRLSSLLDGLVSWWPMDEGVGSTVGDVSANAYHAVFAGGPTWTPGFLGNGLTFDGQDDALTVTMAPALDAPTTLTMAAWIKHSPTGSWRSIIDKRDSAQDGYDLYIGTNSRLFLRVGTATLTGNTLVADGGWHHVAGVYDGTDLLLFVDGVLDAITAVGSIAIDTTADLRIGENYALGNSYFAGTLDEVRIYDRALSDAEVMQLSDQRTGDLASGLLGHWNLDEGTGTTAGDSSVNGYTGTVLGTATWGTGQVLGGLAFDGLTTAIDVGTAPLLDAPQVLTLAAWINHPAATGWHSIIDKRDATQDGYDLYVNTASRLFLRVEDRTLISPTPVADGTWHHVVGVYDGNELVLYVDGQEVARNTIGARTLNTTNALRIGENWSQGNSFFAGNLDEVRVYDRALTAGEVDQLFRFTGN